MLGVVSITQPAAIRMPIIKQDQDPRLIRKAGDRGHKALRHTHDRQGLRPVGQKRR